MQDLFKASPGQFIFTAAVPDPPRADNFSDSGVLSGILREVLDYFLSSSVVPRCSLTPGSPFISLNTPDLFLLG